LPLQSILREYVVILVRHSLIQDQLINVITVVLSALALSVGCTSAVLGWLL